MSPLVCETPETDWKASFSREFQQASLQHLEEGFILFFPNLSFHLTGDETEFLSPHIVRKSKNVSYSVSNREIKGTVLTKQAAFRIGNLMHRFAESTRGLLYNLLPRYRGSLKQGRTSFRPVEIAGRLTSWRKDDTRLHVDCFPSTPLRGRRILRAFSNVNPAGCPRHWRVGEPFPDLAERFFPKLKTSFPGMHTLLHLLCLTRAKRSEYDHYMLQLHDYMKQDLDYQKNARQDALEFPAGGTWLLYTDQVSHAATAGQFQLEQTFYLPVSAMERPATSPLRILEKMAGRCLA
ncbi:MAG: 3-deoxy-D-manno-oct-2-ulosonic acid (Kdo) hydroxylase [Verrucomicrobia bacterium]|nr:MAG: 3-deoxy-D-manno-oct-2-ulosonic acid (Kdo) hydroxylase [Verrucomicrobiota bacterium]